MFFDDTLFNILIILLMVVLFAKISRLNERIKSLEGKKSQNAQVPQQPQVAQSAQLSQVALPPQQTVSAVEETESGAVTEWLKDNWLSKVGVLLILIGFGWFISYAFVHNWIGPIGRVALGFGVGAVLCILGAWRLPKNTNQAGVFLITGSAIIMITGYAARTVYDFFTPFTVLTLDFLTASYVTLLSAKFNKEKLAIYGLCAALVAPIMTHAPDPSVVGLYTYLTVISFASVWVAFYKGWGSLNVVSLFGVLVYSAPYIFGVSNTGETEQLAIVVITSILSLMYLGVNVYEVIYHHSKGIKNAAYIAIANALLIFSVINTLVIEDFRSLLLAGWMIIFAGAGVMVASQTKQQTFFYIYSLIAVLFLGVATALELDGPVLTIAFSLEAAIIALVAYVATRKLRNCAMMSGLMVVPAILGLASLQAMARMDDLVNQDTFVAALVTLLLFGIGSFIRHHYKEAVHDETIRNAFVILNLAGTAFAFVFIWFANEILFGDSFAIIFSLALYTVVGISLYVRGVFNERMIIKRVGAVVVVMVIARLVLIDVWDMPLAARIVLFILIGVLLVSTAFLKKKTHVGGGGEHIVATPEDIQSAQTSQYSQNSYEKNN